MAKAKTRKRRSSSDEDEAPTRRRRSSSSNGSSGSFKVDFRDASPGGKRRFPEGDYKVKIDKAVRDKSQSGNSQIKVTYVIVEPEKYAGKSITDYLTLTRKAAWRIGNLFDAVGIKWSQKILEFKTAKLIGKELGITLSDDEYNGRVKSKVADYLDVDTIDGILSGEDLEDEDDEEEEEDDDLDDMDRAELKAFIKEEDLDVKVAKKMSDDDIREAIRAEQGGEDDEEDEDDEDEDLDEFDDDEL